MKIFNWVHRKFNHGSVRDCVAKGAELGTAEAEKQALGLVDVLEGWKDGILTIGTLGLDPILELSKGYFILDHEVQELEFSDECLNSDSVDDRRIVISKNATSDDDEGEENPLICSSFGDGVGTDNVCLEVQAKPECIAEIRKETKGRGGRVTLAELFQAESDTGKKKKEHIVGGGVDQPEGKKPAALRSKNAKKLIPHKHEKAQPIKNLNRFMRKMLKKKICPELDGKYSKISNDTQNKPGKVEADVESCSGGDSMFLPPPQGF